MNTRDRLAEVIADHTVHVKPTGRGRNYARCSCGWISPALIYIDATYEAHRLHVADALLPVVDAVAAERAAEAERDRDVLAAHLDRVLYDLHPVAANTAGPRGGIGGQALTPWCAVIRPQTDEQQTAQDDADQALREQFRRAEREGYDLRARAAGLTDKDDQR